MTFARSAWYSSVPVIDSVFAMVRLAMSAIVTVEARGMDKKIGAEIEKLAAQDALAAIKVAVPALEKKAGR